jgi:ribosomal protein S11
MWTKCWRRLAGCIAISSGLLAAASPDYRVGTSETGRVKAVVLEDRHGNRAIIADARFTVTLAAADWIAAQLLKSYALNRAGILLHSTGSGEPAPGEAVIAIAAALGDLAPARVYFNGSVVSITSEEGQCRATFFPVASSGCMGGDRVRAPIRAAFQVVEPPHGLQRRNQRPPAYPVQAIAFGRQAAILALGGEAPAARFLAKGRIVVTECNDSTPFPEDSIVTSAIRQVLARAGR